jgi:hypothetical protein
MPTRVMQSRRSHSGQMHCCAGLSRLPLAGWPLNGQRALTVLLVEDDAATGRSSPTGLANKSSVRQFAGDRWPEAV